MQSGKFLNYNLEDVEKNMEEEDPQSQKMLQSQEKKEGTSQTRTRVPIYMQENYMYH